MLYGFDCECGEEIPIGRLDLGYTTCLKCGDEVAGRVLDKIFHIFFAK